MAEAFLKVDGVALPCPSSFTWGLQDISASESGRTDDTTMHKNRVGQKRKLSVEWPRLGHCVQNYTGSKSRVHTGHISRLAVCK